MTVCWFWTNLWFFPNSSFTTFTRVIEFLWDWNYYHLPTTDLIHLPNHWYICKELPWPLISPWSSSERHGQVLCIPYVMLWCLSVLQYDHWVARKACGSLKAASAGLAETESPGWTAVAVTCQGRKLNYTFGGQGGVDNIFRQIWICCECCYCHFSPPAFIYGKLVLYVCCAASPLES